MAIQNALIFNVDVSALEIQKQDVFPVRKSNRSGKLLHFTEKVTNMI